MLLTQVVLDFINREDVRSRNEEIAKAESGGWSIGQLLQKTKGSTSRSTTCYGVVVEVVCAGDAGNEAAYAWPWVLWDGYGADLQTPAFPAATAAHRLIVLACAFPGLRSDDEAMCPSDAQHYLVYRNAYRDAAHASPVSMKLTSELLDAEWTAQTGEVAETIEYTASATASKAKHASATASKAKHASATASKAKHASATASKAKHASATASKAKRVQFTPSAEEVLGNVYALLRQPGDCKEFSEKLQTALDNPFDTVAGQNESSQVLAGESNSASVMNNSAAAENMSPPATSDGTAPTNVAKPDSSVANNTGDDEWTPTEFTAATDPSNLVKQSPTIDSAKTQKIKEKGGLHTLKRKGGSLHGGSLHKKGRSLHKPKGSSLHVSNCAPEQ
eukprot:COSAG02_NODE_430_length_22462_cov_52.755042_6_plen_391_part_00